MPRVNYITKARASKRSRSCRNCGHAIQAGESYKKATPRFGGTMYWCAKHSPRPSDLTTSKIGPLYDVQADFNASRYEDVDDLQAELQSIAEQARDIYYEYEESIQAMPEQFQESSPSAEMSREYMDALEQYADELESWTPSIEDDIEEARSEAEQVVSDLMV